jgi:hypothetical protein
MKVSRQRSIFAACIFAFAGLIFSSPDAHAQAIYNVCKPIKKNVDHEAKVIRRDRAELAGEHDQVRRQQFQQRIDHEVARFRDYQAQLNNCQADERARREAEKERKRKEKQSKQKNKVSCTGPGCKWCPDGYVSVNNRDPCVRIGKEATQKVKQKEAQQKKDKEILNNLIKQKKIADQQKNNEMQTNIQKTKKDTEKNYIRNIR